MWFKFTGAGCAAGGNGQRGRTLRSKKNQFICDKESKFNVPESQVVNIEVNGEEYCGVSLNADNSCFFGPFAIGNTFGALMLVGFENDKRGLLYVN